MSGWNRAEINPVARHTRLFSPQIFSLSFFSLSFSLQPSPLEARDAMPVRVSDLSIRGAPLKKKKENGGNGGRGTFRASFLRLCFAFLRGNMALKRGVPFRRSAAGGQNDRSIHFLRSRLFVKSFSAFPSFCRSQQWLAFSCNVRYSSRS